MKTKLATPKSPRRFFLRLCDNDDAAFDCLFEVSHPKGTADKLRADYDEAYDAILAANPDDWNVDDIMRALRKAGWTVRTLLTVDVNY
jgi:hypothetical protein